MAKDDEDPRDSADSEVFDLLDTHSDYFEKAHRYPQTEQRDDRSKDDD